MTTKTPTFRVLLRTHDPVTRDGLRRVLIHDRADRDAIAPRLMRYRDQNGQHWADIPTSNDWAVGTLASSAMRQIGGRIWLGAAIGFIAGTVAGLVLAVAFHQHAYAFWGFVLGGTIFGTILGGFVGGMSSLESPAPGQEPGDRRA